MDGIRKDVIKLCSHTNSMNWNPSKTQFHIFPFWLWRCLNEDENFEKVKFEWGWELENSHEIHIRIKRRDSRWNSYPKRKEFRENSHRYEKIQNVVNFEKIGHDSFRLYEDMGITWRRGKHTRYLSFIFRISYIVPVSIEKMSERKKFRECRY